MEEAKKEEVPKPKGFGLKAKASIGVILGTAIVTAYKSWPEPSRAPASQVDQVLPGYAILDTRITRVKEHFERQVNSVKEEQDKKNTEIMGELKEVRKDMSAMAATQAKQDARQEMMLEMIQDVRARMPRKLSLGQ